MIELNGRIKGISKDFLSQKYNVTFEIENQPLADIQRLSECPMLDLQEHLHILSLRKMLLRK